MNERSRSGRKPVDHDLVQRARLRHAATQRRIDLYGQALDEAAPAAVAPGKPVLDDLLGHVLLQTVQTMQQLQHAGQLHAQAVRGDAELARLRQLHDEVGRYTAPHDDDVIDVVAREVPSDSR